MTKLTQAQRALLLAAASQPDGLVDAAPGEHARTVKTRLIKAGLLLTVPIDGGGERLLVTQEGRAAVADPATPNEPQADGSPANNVEPSVTPDPAPAPKSKIGIVVGLISRAEGATIAELMQATGWQAHSVRGALSGTVKKALGMKVVSQPSDTGRVYRLTQEGR